MAKLYLQKINNKEINIATGDVWKLEDVPMLWRAEVEAMLTFTSIKSIEAENE
jgi:hypothetical protein